MKQPKHAPSKPRSIAGIFIDALVGVANEIQAQDVSSGPHIADLDDLAGMPFAGMPFMGDVEPGLKRTKKPVKRSYLANFDKVVIPPNSTAQIPSKVYSQFRVDGLFISAHLHQGAEAVIPFPEKGAIFTNESMEARRASTAPSTDEECLKFLSIQDFKVGKNSQFMNAAAVPAEVFNIAFLNDHKVRYDLTPMGAEVRVDIRNEASVPLVVMVTMSGTSD